jgi:sugar diacid utilization regulator
LKAIAHQAAVALEKASLYREKEETVKQLEVLNHTITVQNKMLSRSVDIHNSLADLVLNGEGLDSIISYLYQKIGYPILLFDDLGELISSSYKTPLSMDSLISIKQQALELMESPDMTRSFIDMKLSDRTLGITLLPIGTRPRLFGSLIIVASEMISEVDVAALEHACTVISLEMVKEQAVVDTQERMNGELIEVLFSGKIDESILQKAKLMNFDPMGHYIAVIIHLEEIETGLNRNSILRHLVHMANHVFLKNYLHGMAVRNHDQIVVLLTYQQKVSTTYASLQVKELVAHFHQEIQMKNWGTTVSIGIGRIHSTLLKVTKSLQEATKCLQYIHSYGQKNEVVSYKDLGVQRLLLQNTEEETIDFINEVLGPLIEYDQLRKGELLPSLITYLEYNQNAKEAAESIHVHTNTMLYRLKRIEEILSIDLTDNQQFLNVHLAVSLYPVLKGVRPHHKIQ